MFHISEIRNCDKILKECNISNVLDDTEDNTLFEIVKMNVWTISEIEENEMK